MARQPKGRPSIYEGTDGWFHCYLTVGRKPDGKLDRRHIRGKTAAAVAEGITKLEEKLRIGHVPKVGTTPTVGDWLEEYLTVVAPRRVRASTLQGYESTLRHNVIPAIGHLRLNRPLAEMVGAIEAFFTAFERRAAPAFALQTFHILSGALEIAVKRGLLPRNPCDLVDKPSGGGNPDVDPLTVDEIRRVLDAAAQTGALARWWVALALGLRQGEVLGLMWDYVDLDSSVPTLRVQWELLRLKWRHGCTDPCGKRPASCPARVGGGLVFAPPKSKKSRRLLPLPEVLVQVLKEHRRQQRELRMAAGPRWKRMLGPDGEAGGLVFPQDDGRPTDPRRDWGQWKDILVAARVRVVERVAQRGRKAGEPYVTSKVRVHDARHAAGTEMFAGGMDRREIMEWMGHSQISVSARYTHVSAEMMQLRAEQMNASLEAMQPHAATGRPGRSR